MGSPAAEIARSPAAWERLAKDWIVELIERTPLAELQDLPLAWMTQEAPPLIAEILGQLSDPGPASELQLPPAAEERAASLVAARPPGASTRSLPRELAALHALLIEALDRELPRSERGEFARAVARLAEVFGAVGAAAMASLDLEPTPPPPVARPESTREGALASVEAAVAAARETGTLTVAWVDVDGVERIAEGYGEAAATDIADAVASIVEAEIGASERSVRLGPGAVVVLAPNQDAIDLAQLGVRVADLVAASQGDGGTLLDVRVGVAAHPAGDGSARDLLDAAEEAAWAARAAGDQVAVARAEPLEER